MRPERRRAPSSRASACAATAAPTSVPALDLGKGRGHSEGDEERRARETKRDLYLHWQRHRRGIHRIRPGSVGSSRPPIGSGSPPPRTARRRRQGGMGRPPPTRSGQGGRRGPDPHEGEREEKRARRRWMSRRRARKGARSRAQKPTRAPCPQRRRWMLRRERSGEVVTTEWRGDCLGLARSGEWGGRLASDSVARNGEEVGPTGGGRERQRSGVENPNSSYI